MSAISPTTVISSGPVKESPSDVKTVEKIVPDVCYDKARHLSTFKLKEEKNHAHGEVAFTPMLPYGSIDGFFPTTPLKGCTLASNGKKGTDTRGFRIVDFVMKNGGTKCQFLSLALGVPKEGQWMSDIIKGSIQRFVEAYDPIKRSSWYQKTFPDLDDGTKVFTATAALQSHDQFQYMELQGEEEWDSPKNTWGPFVYGSDKETKMYINLSVDDTRHVIRCFDEKMKKMPKKETNSVVMYPKDGIALSNSTQLRLFLESEFYTKKRWTARVMARITRVVFRCGQVGVHAGTTNPVYGIYPVFKFKTDSDIALIESSNLGSGTLDEDTLDVAKNLLLYEGLPMPTKKRKRAAPKKIFGVSSQQESASDDGKADEVVAESDGEE
jgi:hypothetical protein